MKNNYHFLLFIVILFFNIPDLKAQKVLQIEKYGNPNTTKIFIGQSVTYRLKGDELWRFAYIEDILIEENTILLGNRYVNVESIDAFRYEKRFAKAASTSLFLFGAAWSGFAAVGTATDGNDATRYQWSDAIVTGSSWLLALISGKFLRYKTIKFGKRKRIRLLDISFQRVVP